MRKIGVALCQTPSLSNVFSSVATAQEIARNCVSEYVSAAKAKHPSCEIVLLPEAWSLPYATKYFEPFAEEVPEPFQCLQDNQKSSKILSDLALKHKIWIIGGSVAEKHEGKLYNTSIVLNPAGCVVAKHRKVHLFDINVPGKMYFKESDVLTAGSKITTFETPWGLFGLGICYDVRFVEMAVVMRERGVKAIFYPGSFNVTTGSAHWNALMRGRAIDTQSYVFACAPARCSDDGPEGYPAWGHSMGVDPWGNVAIDLGDQPGIGYAEIDFDYVEEVRRNIPTTVQRRGDLYEVIDKHR